MNQLLSELSHLSVPPSIILSIPWMSGKLTHGTHLQLHFVILVWWLLFLWETYWFSYPFQVFIASVPLSSKMKSPLSLLPSNCQQNNKTKCWDDRCLTLLLWKFLYFVFPVFKYNLIIVNDREYNSHFPAETGFVLPSCVKEILFLASIVWLLFCFESVFCL
jgi:hypothetical protein